ncbi:MAG: class I SAM-dependent methyltransferase [Methanobacterium sp.]|nr:class I SAM-dependent methyltransferase [Methanobacterium sp.]
MKKKYGWVFNEKQIGVDYLDQKIAESYEYEHLKFRNFESEALDVINRLEITEEDIVIDFGCGTGGIALNIAEHCKKVICVDISDKMLNILKNNADKKGIKNIETYCAGFLSYQHEGEPADKIVSKVALHHLPDFWKSVALMNMVNNLKKDGKLYLFDIIFSFEPREHEKSINNLIETYQAMAGDNMGAEAVIHIKDEYSTYDWIMEGLLERTGFKIDLKQIEAENHITYVCTKK